MSHYRYLQQALKYVRDELSVPLTCKLNAKTEVLQAEYDRLITFVSDFDTETDLTATYSSATIDGIGAALNALPTKGTDTDTTSTVVEPTEVVLDQGPLHRQGPTLKTVDLIAALGNEPKGAKGRINKLLQQLDDNTKAQRTIDAAIFTVATVALDELSDVLDRTQGQVYYATEKKYQPHRLRNESRYESRKFLPNKLPKQYSHR